MTDKAVSTEDLCFDKETRNASLEAARLEAVIKTLIENKVDSLKSAKRKSSSITSSPKSLFNKLKGNSSTSTVSSNRDTEMEQRKKGERIEHRKRKSPVRNLQFSDEGNENFAFLHKDYIVECGEHCCRNPNEIGIHIEDDFISLNLEEYENLNTTEMGAVKSIKRAQRRKKRRRKHHKKHLKMVAVQVTDLKELDDDELSQRARMTIVFTAFLLLFMCLLLVGITLRMAPLIDDMVRKENEELMNSLGEEHNLNFSVPSL